MSWSSSASRPFEVMVKAPGPFGLARPKIPSLAAIFIGTGGGSRFASAASLSLRSQSKSSAVRFESMSIIISRMDLQTVRAAYRRYARVYDALFGPVLQPGRKAVVKALGCRPGERVLEVGVGTGLSLPLYPPHTRVTGIDVSTEMLDKARARVENRRLANVEALLEMNAEEMTFPDASFDKVVAMYVVSVVERPARLLEELHRVCRPQGEIFIVNHLRADNPVLGAVESATPAQRHRASAVRGQMAGRRRVMKGGVTSCAPRP